MLELPLVIATSYESSEQFTKTLRADGGIQFSGSTQVIINGDSLPSELYGFKARVDIYKDGSYIESQYMTTLNYPDRTEFTFTYTPGGDGQYQFNLYYEDPFEQAATLLLNASISYQGTMGVMQQVNAITVPGAIILAAILGVSSTGLIVFSSKKRGVLHKKFKR